jgi:hypothetical protein
MAKNKLWDNIGKSAYKAVQFQNIGGFSGAKERFDNNLNIVKNNPKESLAIATALAYGKSKLPYSNKVSNIINSLKNKRFDFMTNNNTKVGIGQYNAKTDAYDVNKFNYQKAFGVTLEKRF